MDNAIMRCGALVFLAAGVAVLPCGARAGDTANTTAVSVDAQWTLDVLRAAGGGIQTGNRLISDLDLGAGWQGQSGWSARADVLVDHGGGFSAAYSGDMQGVSNNDGPAGIRLFQAYMAWSSSDGSADATLGMMDFSSHFDVETPGGGFLNSSRHIGTDIAQAGVSISPVSALGVAGDWQPFPGWWLRGGVFDGVPGDPSHLSVFSSLRLSHDEGAFVIAEGERAFDNGYVKLGHWRRSALSDRIDGSGQGRSSGTYGAAGFTLSHEAADPAQGTHALIRLGQASGGTLPTMATASLVLQYDGLLPGRDKDSAGLSATSLHLSSAYRASGGLAATETNYELFYSLHASAHLTVTPDLQLIAHPSGRKDIGNAVVAGIRLTLSTGN